MLYRIKKPIIRKLALVKDPASGHRWHLLKSSSPAAGEIIQPTTPDWRVAYTVVAAPGHAESGGITQDGTVAKGEDGRPIQDVWDETSIREAAHSFPRNGGLTVDAHFTDGQTLGRWAESYIAPVDHEINGRGIAAGSWVLGIEPTPAGRAAIERGEIRGVSVEGSSLREPVLKAAAPAAPAPDLDGVMALIKACATDADADRAVAGLALSLEPKQRKALVDEMQFRLEMEGKVADLERQHQAQQAAREALAKADPGDPRAAGRALARRIAEQADRAEIRHRMELHNARMRARRATSSQHGTGWLHPQPTVKVSADQAAGMVMRLRQADPKPRGRF